MSQKEYHDVYRGYRPHLEHGVWVWYREIPKHVVGVHPDLKKPIRIAKSGFPTADLRVPTNTADYEVACAMLDRKLEKPKPQPKYKKDPGQTSMFNG